MFKILLIEENTILRTGMKALIDVHPEFQLFAEAISIQEALTINPLGKIDLIITDISVVQLKIMQDMEALRSSFPEARVLIFTHPGNKEGAMQSLEAGAASYLFKHASGEELINAMKVLVGETSIIEGSVIS